MLVLRRKGGESIVVGGSVVIRILQIEGDRVKIGIEAPADVVIVRSELLTREGLEIPDPEGLREVV
jgi:carbon storage regulator